MRGLLVPPTMNGMQNQARRWMSRMRLAMVRRAKSEAKTAAAGTELPVLRALAMVARIGD